MSDLYKTIRATSEGYYTEKRSRFLSFAIPVRTPEEAKLQVEACRKKYYDARHVCWAYMLGAAAEAIAAAEVEERTVDAECTVVFEYPSLKDIMRVVKDMQPAIVSQTFETNCEMTLRIRQSREEILKSRLLMIEGAYLKDDEQLTIDDKKESL